MSTQNPELQPPAPHAKNATLQPDAPDFIETPDVVSSPATDHEPLPIWIYLICGFALFMAGSSFTGFGGLYDQGPGQPIVATAPVVTVAITDPVLLGKNIYNSNCANCHQASGAGQPGTYPPIDGSEWVQGAQTRLAAILLHGADGSLTVKGSSYDGQMPAWAGILDDEKIADVMTYIRGAWTNKADAVKADAVTADRTKFAGETDPYTQAALQKIPPQ